MHHLGSYNATAFDELAPVTLIFAQRCISSFCFINFLKCQLCNYTKYIMVLWTSAWVLSEKVISLNIQGTCPMELQLVILDVPFFSYIIVILWVIVLWKWWIIWPKYKKTSSLIKKCLFLCFWADYLHYLIRLLFFCCPEPRMLKWLYAGNAFDEWTYAPCSAALYNVDS